MAGSHQKNTIQNRLSALLRACPPGRLVLVCGAMEKQLPKNKDVFWTVWEPQYQEANNVIFSANSPAILKKIGEDIIHQQQKKRIGSINFLPVFPHSDYFLFFPCPSGRITKAGNGEGFQVKRNTIRQPDGTAIDGKKNWGGN
jgi:hypothetical protein